MVRAVLLLVVTLLPQLAAAQKKPKWPYFSNPVPPYIGVAGSYEGLKTNNYQAGLVVNVLPLSVSPPVGAMVGGGLFYKQNMSKSLLRSYEAEIGCYGGIVIGLNYNHNITTSGDIPGFKPFVGIAVYNAQLFYGYCFYRTASDISGELRHNRITLRYVIPVVKLKKY